MTYAVLTLDDVVGMLPTLSILGLMLYGMMQCLIFVLRIVMPCGATKNTDDNAKLLSSNSAAFSEMNLKSILFLLFLSYLLSPLSTMRHLRGKRLNNDNSNSDHGLHDLVYGSDPRLQKMLALVPSLARGPKPPLLFTNRHLQFIPWLLQNELHRQEGLPFQRLDFAVKGCLDKSQGTEHCIRSPLMDDTITLDVFPPFDTSGEEEDKYPGFHADSPIIFFSPGLRCYSQDMPGNMIIRRAFGEGFRSVVVNRRGHTPDRKLRAPRWNLFGDTDDLEQVYWHVQQEWAAPHTPFFLHGISSGTSVVVSALGEYDRRRLAMEQLTTSNATLSDSNTTHHAAETAASTLPLRVAPSFVASVSITPGYDISKVLLPERFKYPYNPLMLDAVKKTFVLDHEPVLRAFNSEAVDAALRATHLQEFVDAAAPFAGYPNATEYYKGENPVNDMHFVTTPKLVLNSIDDPCCHVHNIYEQSPYPQHNGKNYANLIDESERGMLAVTKSGTHCPFLDSSPDTIMGALLPAVIKDPFNGRWMLDSWADRVSIEFYKAALEVYEERRYMQ